ncbi:hypothetical protein MYX84_11590, partial [Acidobacteria bacterium AH-259-O06]|nr:hypothetical protein [Acidobacteria bacterium AH-259-O06]
ISLPGTGEAPKAPVYVDGQHFTTLKGPDIAKEFIEILEKYVNERFKEPGARSEELEFRIQNPESRM